MAYVKIIYQDSPSTATPLNAQNLNHMDDGIAENDRRLNELATAGVVNTFNGRRGAVTPESGDYTADMIPYDEENSVGDILGNATSEIDGITVANASGESFALVPTSEGNALATHIYGMSVQDGTPTPSSPVDIVSSKADFRCVGKNLIPYPFYETTKTSNNITFTDNKDGTVSASASQTTSVEKTSFYIYSCSNSNIRIVLKAGVRYALQGDTTAVGSERLVVTDLNRTTILINNAGGIVYYTPSEDIIVGDIYIRYYNSKSVPFNEKWYPMLYIADKNTEWEPYKHTDITTDLTLRAIEVTSSDDYNLIRDGKYYISDTVDWSEDDGYVLTRRIKESVIDGSFGVGTSTDGHTMTISNLYAVSECVNFVSPNNRFVAIEGSSLTLADANSKLSDGECLKRSNKYSMGASDYFKNTSMNSVSDWETWLASNPITIYDILTTPTTEPLTSEQAQSLLSLKTYDVSTSINAQASPEPTVELEYAKTQTTAMALSGHNEALIAQELEGLYGAKNLISYPYKDTTKSSNGITFTDNGDGTVTVSGTASATVTFDLCTRMQGEINDIILKNGTYILSGCPSGGSATGYRITTAITKNSVSTSLGQDTGNGVTIIANGDDYSADTINLGLGITIGNGTVISSPITFKPMLRLATNTSNTYQPYAMSNYELTQKIRELETAIIELGGN